LYRYAKVKKNEQAIKQTRQYQLMKSKK